MRLTSILIVTWMLAAETSVFGQIEASSKHHFSFYVNDKERLAAEADISVVVSGDTVKSKRVDNFYYFPVIDTAKQFDLIVRVNGITFSGQGYPGWMLNKGSQITFGRLTKLMNLTSVADYNGMARTDEGYEWYSKRFFVINRTYTLDIDNRNKIKELQFLIISPKTSGRLVTTQKVVR